MKLDFDGRVVTGAAQGNGAAMARGFAAAGAQVVVADRKIAAAQDTAEHIRASGGQADAYELDVSDAQACQRLADHALKNFG